MAAAIPIRLQRGPIATQSADGTNHFAQPLPAVINIPGGGRALLRISDLDVSEYQTLASLGIPMNVVGYNAKLLRDQEGTQHKLPDQLDHVGGWRVARRDPGRERHREVSNPGRSFTCTRPTSITSRTTQRTSAA